MAIRPSDAADAGNVAGQRSVDSGLESHNAFELGVAGPEVADGASAAVNNGAIFKVQLLVDNLVLTRIPQAKSALEATVMVFNVLPAPMNCWNPKLPALI